MRLLFWQFIFLFISNLLSAQSTKPSGGVLDLSEAVRQKMLSLSVSSKGGHTGETLELTFKNLKGKPFRIRIPQGQFMEPADTGMQTLVVAREQYVNVTAKTNARTLLHTFCAQAGDRSPSSGTSFALGAMAPERVCKLLQYLTEKNLIDSPDAQTAVWCVTSRSNPAGIENRELARFTAELLGKKPPVYRITYETREEPGKMADLGKAMVVDCNYQYTLEKNEYLSLILYDAADKEVKVLRKDEFTKAGEHRTSFHLKVWQLTPGKYTVKLQKKNGEVVKSVEVEF
jgi:hypothetical protein